MGKRWIVSIAAIWIALSLAAAAEAQDVATSLPKVAVDAEADDDIPRQSTITADVEDCFGFDSWSPFVPGIDTDDDGEDELPECAQMELALYRNGKVIDREKFWAGEYQINWKCSRSGSYRYVLAYLNSVNFPDGKPYVKFSEGTFRIPKCRRPVDLRVLKASAFEAAEFEAEKRWGDQFVSRIRCTAASRLRAGRAAKWSCLIVRNSNVKICANRLLLHHTSKNQFGQPERTYKVVGNRLVACEAF